MKGTLLVLLCAFLVELALGYNSRYPPMYGRPARRRWYWKPLFIGKRSQEVTTEGPHECLADKDCPVQNCCLKRKSQNGLATVKPEGQGRCELTPLHGDLCVLDTGSWSGHLCPCEAGAVCRPLENEQEIGVCWKPNT